MRLIRIQPLRQAGESIVEVMIVLAVISLTLTAAYASATRNVTTVQDTQEHSQALQLAQSQVEFLRAGGFLTTDQCFSAAGVPILRAAMNCTLTVDGVAYDVDITTPVSSTIYQVAITWDSLLGGTNNVTLYYGVGGS